MATRTVKSGDVIRLDGELLYTFGTGTDLGVVGDDFHFVVGAHPTPSTFASETRQAIEGQPTADVWLNGAVIRQLKAGKHTFNLPGNDLIIDVAPPAPVINQPIGTKIPSGQPIPNSGAAPILLERGGTYTGQIAPASNTVYGTFGDPAKPMPIVKGSVRFDGKSNITIDGIAFQGGGQAGHALIDIYNSSNVKLLNLSLTGNGFNGINIQGYGGHRCSSILVRGCLVADNFPKDATKHCEGMYVQDTDGLVLDGNVFSNNGGKPGVETIYNHNVYIHGSNGPATVTNNVFHAASSHGLQQRSGGTCQGNLFLDNPIHQSYGLVNGEACFPGGVSGTIENNIYIGGGDINGAKRGWCLEISNAKSVTVRNLLCAHDNQGFSKAIHVAECSNLTNLAQYLKPASWSISMNNVFVYDWPPGAMDVQSVNNHPIWTLAPGSIVGGAPPQQPKLRDVLGAGFVAWARANPAQAGSAAVSKCKAAAGMA